MKKESRQSFGCFRYLICLPYSIDIPGMTSGVGKGVLLGKSKDNST